MACRDCGPSVPATTLPETQRFSCPVDGAEIEIVVRGTVTPASEPLVRAFLSFVYEVLVPVTPAEGESHG